MHTAIAGIRIPDGRIAREATELVRDIATPLLFDHSRRVFLWGSLQGENLALDYDPELLCVGAMFHEATATGYRRPNFGDFIRSSRREVRSS